MVFSTKYSLYVLRIGLAVVFFWFGIDSFFHPSYWLQTWMPDWVNIQTVYVVGVFNVLVGLSLVTGVFMRFFAIVGVVFLLAMITFGGVLEINIRDAGLLGGLLAIVLWPERQS